MHKPGDKIQITRGYLAGKKGEITLARPSMQDRTTLEYRITLEGQTKPSEHSFRDADLEPQ